MNTDAGATLGWPELVATVATVHRDLPPGERARAVILTENYGEAGALEQARSRLGLPPVFSGHLGFGEWGPPPDGATPTIAVGLDRAPLDELFASVTPAARIDNGVGLDTEEHGRTVWICREQRLTLAPSASPSSVSAYFPHSLVTTIEYNRAQTQHRVS